MIRVHSCHMICTCYVFSCSFLPTPATENLYFFQNILKHNMVLRIREFIRKLIPSDPRLPPKQLIPPDPRLPPKQLIPSDPWLLKKKLIPSDPRLLPKNWFLQIHDFFSFNFDFVRSLKDRLVPLIMGFAVFCVLFPFAFDLLHCDIWKKDVNELKLKFCRNFRMLISNHRIQEQDLPDYPKSVFWIKNAMKPSDSCKIEII
jgi:hypothetical protein